MSAELIKALLVTAEVTGTELSEGAAMVIAEELASLNRNHVMGALKRCRRELKGRLTLAAILERLDDGRPSAEEAFGMLPRDESQTVVWTDEIAEASSIALPLLDAGDKVSARMAFKDTYSRLVSAARDAGKPARWWVSYGHDVKGREGPVRAAIDKGLLSVEYAGEFDALPVSESPALLDMARKALRRA